MVLRVTTLAGDEMLRIDEMLSSATSWIVAGLLSGIVWLVRRALTNEQKIALLEADLKRRDVVRSEDREVIAQIQKDLQDMKVFLMRHTS